MFRDDYGYPVLSVDRPYNISSSIGQMLIHQNVMVPY